MKTILLPTDFSLNSNNAISYALNFYKDEECHFILLHAYKVNGYRQHSTFIPIPGNTEREKVRKDCQVKINKLLKEIEQRYPNPLHRFSTVTQNQQLVAAIGEELGKQQITVIIIGTQGNTAARDVSYGSNTIDIMEEIHNCPILAIPSHVRFSKIKEVVLASGFKIPPLEEEYIFIKELLEKTGASLRVLHIEENWLSEAQRGNREELKKVLTVVPHSFHTLAHVSVPIGIYCFTESRGSDMIAFVNKRHSFFQNVLFNPLYKNLGNYSQIPVLIMQTRETYKH
ncbi:MAG TPA: universal stress protein [Gillisia sp.]|nr:universal stress protein [Gillisia sp.]